MRAPQALQNMGLAASPCVLDFDRRRPIAQRNHMVRSSQPVCSPVSVPPVQAVPESSQRTLRRPVTGYIAVYTADMSTLLCYVSTTQQYCARAASAKQFTYQQVASGPVAFQQTNNPGTYLELYAITLRIRTTLLRRQRMLRVSSRAGSSNTCCSYIN